MRALRTLALELAAFAALAWYAAAHWASGLVADAPGGRVFACVLIAVAVAVVLFLADAAPTASGVGAAHRRHPRRARGGLRRDRVGRQVSRARTLGRAGRRARSRLHVARLRAVALQRRGAVGHARAAARDPARADGCRCIRVLAEGRSLRPFAVVLLVALFGFAVTEHRFDSELGRGAGLLFFTAAWLWLPRMPERGARTAAIAAGAVLVACIAALPAAARYDDRDPLIDYQSWNPFAAHATTRFDWSHDYGPIDWPRDGTTLMYVKVERAQLLEARDARCLRRGPLGPVRLRPGQQPAPAGALQPDLGDRSPCDDRRPRHGRDPDRRHRARDHGRRLGRAADRGRDGRGARGAA